MAKVIGKAGASCIEMANTRRKKRRLVALCCLVIVLSLMCFLISQMFHAATIGSAVLAIVCIVAFKVIDRKSDRYDTAMVNSERRARRGAKGEESVAAVLEGLPDEYVVIHDVASAYGNIDHVVVAPTGVFVIETKSHHGTISQENGALLCNGKAVEKNFISQTLQNTYWVKELLQKQCGVGLFVNAMIVFSNAFVPRMVPIKEVRIINQKFLINTISSSKRGNVPVDAVVQAICGDAKLA